MDIRKGKLKGFRGNWMSGLAYLVIEDSESGMTEEVMCENGSTVRALEGCFGNVIGDAHCVEPDERAGFYDKEVYWNMDEMGLILAGFTPVDDAPEEVVALFNQERG